MIVIPMAGQSARFTHEGYDRPRFMLPLGADTVFDRALTSFVRYFASLPFLLVTRDYDGAGAFVKQRCAALGIEDARIVIVEHLTAGQADTVSLRLEWVLVDEGAELTIFSIDTFRPNFTYPKGTWFAKTDRHLEIFRGTGANWSYVRPDPDQHLALETAEKRFLSDLCCTGLYYFRAAGAFRQALAAERQRPTASELFIATLYNQLIAKGKLVHYDLIDPSAVQFCGIPNEYVAAGGLPPTSPPSGSLV